MHKEINKIRKNMIIDMSVCIIGACSLTYLSMMFCSLAIELEWSELEVPLMLFGAVVSPIIFSIIAAIGLHYYLKLLLISINEDARNSSSGGNI